MQKLLLLLSLWASLAWAGPQWHRPDGSIDWMSDGEYEQLMGQLISVRGTLLKPSEEVVVRFGELDFANSPDLQKELIERLETSLMMARGNGNNYGDVTVEALRIQASLIAGNGYDSKLKDDFLSDHSILPALCFRDLMARILAHSVSDPERKSWSAAMKWLSRSRGSAYLVVDYLLKHVAALDNLLVLEGLEAILYDPQSQWDESDISTEIGRRVVAKLELKLRKSKLPLLDRAQKLRDHIGCSTDVKKAGRGVRKPEKAD